MRRAMYGEWESSPPGLIRYCTWRRWPAHLQSTRTARCLAERIASLAPKVVGRDTPKDTPARVLPIGNGYSRSSMNVSLHAPVSRTFSSLKSKTASMARPKPAALLLRFSDQRMLAAKARCADRPKRRKATKPLSKWRGASSSPKTGSGARRTKPGRASRLSKGRGAPYSPESKSELTLLRRLYQQEEGRTLGGRA